MKKNLQDKKSLPIHTLPLLTPFFRLLPMHTIALRKLGLTTPEDILRHIPSRYIRGGGTRRIADLEDGMEASIFGEVIKTETMKTFHSRMPAALVSVRDDSGTIRAMWLRQPYIAKMLQVGDFVRLDGTVKIGGKKSPTKTMLNPHHEKVKKLPGDTPGTLFEGTKIEDILYPIYPETRGLSSLWFTHAVKRLFERGVLDTLTDPIPEDILKRYHLPELKTALIYAHTPQNERHSEAARKRFAFEEVFILQLRRQDARLRYLEHKAFLIPSAGQVAESFTSRFPFTLTEAQEHAISDIAKDLSSESPMLRLLEGDVGSGKTAVAAATAYAVIEAKSGAQRLQVAYMCPTEILAEQQFASFIQNFRGLQVPVGLMTGSGCKKFPSKVHPSGSTDISRTQLLKWVKNGEIPILVGTHALIQKSVEFKNLAYVIIDEQHRFGTAQRAKLAKKHALAPHVLSMTATPIPRTLALTVYGDLDLTLLDAMPPGRKPVITALVPPTERETTYTHMKNELALGRQAYVICPRINEPDPEKEMAVQAKSAKSEAERLKKIFPKSTVGLLHGKMKSSEKDKAMEEFLSGKTHILVATTVIEVGVNVPNATIIVIEGAERFGLAQLHQLRGRVIRGNHQAYCYLFTDSNASTTKERLKALVEAKNGFELAERDLTLRGAGELDGGKQWGVSDIGMEAIRNLKLVEAARNEARRLLLEDRNLTHCPTLAKHLSKKIDIHGE